MQEIFSVTTYSKYFGGGGREPASGTGSLTGLRLLLHLDLGPSGPKNSTRLHFSHPTVCSGPSQLMSSEAN